MNIFLHICLMHPNKKVIYEGFMFVLTEKI